MIKFSFNKPKESLKEYSIFALILALAIGSFYLFSAMGQDKVLLQLGGTYGLEAFLIIGKISLIILLGLFLWLVFPFFLASQKKEWETYFILGMKKSTLFFKVSLEQLSVLVLSSILGLLGGSFLSKLFGQLLVKLMGETRSISFLFSLSSVKEVFLLIFFFACLMEIKIFLDIYLLKKEDKLPLPKKKTYLGLIGLMLIFIGYYFAVTFPKRLVMEVNSDVEVILLNFFLPFFILFLCIVGTILFFSYFPWGFKNFFYHDDLLLLMMENLKIQLRKSRKILSVIAIFSGMTFGFLGGAFYLNNLSEETLKQEVPVDFQVAKEDFPTLEDVLTNHHLKIATTLNTTYGIVPGKKNTEDDFFPVNFLKESDYNALRQVNPQMPKIDPLLDHEFIFLSDITYLSLKDEAFHTLRLKNGETLNVKKRIPNHLGNSNLRYNFSTVVVSDKLFQAQSSFTYDIVSITVDKSIGKEVLQKENETVLASFKGEFNEEITYDFSSEDKNNWTITKEEENSGRKKLNFVSWYQVQKNFKGQTGMLLYFTFFLGFVFFMVTPSVLVVHQLDNAKKRPGDYRLMRLLGISEEKIYQGVFLENAFIFFLPLIIGFFHGFFALKMVTGLLPPLAQEKNIYFWLFFLVVYGLFYVLCCRHYYRWLKK